MLINKITRLYFLLALALVGGCSVFKPRHEPAAPKADPGIVLLRQKYAVTFEALLKASDPASHWPSVTDCDGTLWSGLSLAVGEPVNLALAEYAPGEIHRRPTECYPAESASTVSNDMLLGYLWGMWEKGDLDALQRLADYGEKNHWTMGKGDVSATVFRPNGSGLLGRAIYALSDGKDDRSYRQVPPLFTPVTADYEKHLMAEAITLNGSVNEMLRSKNLGGGLGLLDVSSQDLLRLKELENSDGTDALFGAALATYTGDYAKTIGLLLSDAAPPSYVRGSDTYRLVYWLKAAKLVLDRYPAP